MNTYVCTQKTNKLFKTNTMAMSVYLSPIKILGMHQPRMKPLSLDGEHCRNLTTEP